MESEGVSEGRSKAGVSKVAGKGYQGGAPHKRERLESQGRRSCEESFLTSSQKNSNYLNNLLTQKVRAQHLQCRMPIRGFE